LAKAASAQHPATAPAPGFANRYSEPKLAEVYRGSKWQAAAMMIEGLQHIVQACCAHAGVADAAADMPGYCDI
jgi:hypothetical protein